MISAVPIVADGFRSHSSPDRVEAGGSEGEAREAGLNELAHRYRPGDRVIFHSPATLPQFDGPYLVERLLPVSDAGPQYQIKSIRDGHERAASERELAPGYALRILETTAAG
jgi:hypothetical protein